MEGEKTDEMTADEQREISKRIIGTPFPKGVSGNPGGRPKGSLSLTALLKRKLAENPDVAEALIDDMIDQARKGNAAPLKEIWNRNDGPITEKQETNGTIRVIFEGDDGSPTEALPGTEDDL